MEEGVCDESVPEDASRAASTKLAMTLWQDITEHSFKVERGAIRPQFKQ
jgi:hypothetical protein